mmetsp:Transcript_77331/g.240278  ORF Transcript_77331/g.240278 Transcript_77331/m.240278 type:complete len:101 (+) Transcript_77331:195-497(+)
MGACMEPAGLHLEQPRAKNMQAAVGCIARHTKSKPECAIAEQVLLTSTLAHAAEAASAPAAPLLAGRRSSPPAQAPPFTTPGRQFVPPLLTGRGSTCSSR